MPGTGDLMKQFKRVILILVPILLALMLGAYFAIRSAFPPERIAALVTTEGSAILGRDVKVGKVIVGVFPRLKLGVRAVEVANDSGFSSEPLLTLKSLDLSISWLSLLRFSPQIYEIRLVEPNILFEVDSTGRTNLQSLGSQDSTLEDTATALPELPASVSLESFVIENGRVRYRDTQGGQEITLGRIDQQASLSLDPKLTNVLTAGSLTIAEISLSDAASGVRKGGVKIAVTHDLHVDLPGDSLTIRNVTLSFQDVKAHVKGSLREFSTPTPTADIHVSAPEISLASLFAEIPSEISPELGKLKVAGTASLNVSLQGVLDTAPEKAIRALKADIGLRNGSFGHKDVPQGISDFTVDLSVRGDSVRLKNLSFHSGPNPFTVEFLITEILNPVPFLRSLKVGGELDYGNLVALAHKMEVLDPTINVSGRQTFRVSASGPLDPTHPENLSVNGRSELIGINAQVPDFPVVQARGITTFTGETIRQQLTVKLGHSDATVGVLVKNYLSLVLSENPGGPPNPRTHIGVDIKSSLIDLDELLPKTGSDAPDTSAPLTAYPDWPPLDADVTISLARTRLMNLDLSNYSQTVTVRQQSARSDLKGTLYSGGFSSSVVVTPRDSLDWGFGFKLNVNKVEANDFISRLNDRVPLQNKMLRSLAGTDSALFGKFTMALDLKTHGLPAAFASNLSGPIVFSVTDGKIVGVEWTKSLSASLAKAHSSLGFEQLEFSELKGDLLAENGNLVVRDLSFDSPRAGAGRAAGTIGFDNSLKLQLTQALPPAATAMVTGASNALLGQLQKFAPGLPGGSLFPSDNQGRALLYFIVDGDLSKPRFALDAKRMASEGSGNAVKASAQKALQDAARKKQEELSARAQEERAKLEAAAKAKFDAEKKRLEDAAAAEKKKLSDKAAAEAKKQGKKILEGLGK